MDRITIRDWKMSDLDDYHNLMIDEEVLSAAAMSKHETLEQSTKMLEHFIESGDCHAIELNETNRVIGFIGLYRDYTRFNKFAKTIGFVLAKKHWNKGYVSEAVPIYLDKAFKTTDVNLVSARCFTDNAGSRKVLEKNRFKYEGEQREAFLINEKIVKNFLMYSLRKDEF